MADGAVFGYIATTLNAVIIPWLILIERRLSRIEGYLKAKAGYNGGLQ